MRALLFCALSLPALATAHAGEAFHWHGAELALAVAAVLALSYLLRR